MADRNDGNAATDHMLSFELLSAVHSESFISVELMQQCLLLDQQRPSLSEEKLKRECDELKAKNYELKQQVTSLRMENMKLQTTNDTLKHNFTTLYQVALSKLNERDLEIASLRKSLHLLTRSDQNTSLVPVSNSSNALNSSATSTENSCKTDASALACINTEKVLMDSSCQEKNVDHSVSWVVTPSPGLGELNVPPEGVQHAKERTVLLEGVQSAKERTVLLESAQPAKETTVSLESAQPAKERAVSSRGVQSAKERTVLLESAQPAKETTVSLESAQPAKERAVSSRGVQSAKERTVLLEGALPAQERTVPLEGVQPAKETTVPLESAQPATERTVSSGGVQSAKERTVLLESAQPAKETTVSLESAQPAKERAVSSRGVQSAKERTVLLEGALPAQERTVPLEGVQPAKETTVPLESAQPATERTVSSGRVQSAKERTVLLEGVQPAKKRTVPLEGVQPAKETAVPLESVQPAKEITVLLEGVQPAKPNVGESTDLHNGDSESPQSYKNPSMDSTAAQLIVNIEQNKSVVPDTVTVTSSIRKSHNLATFSKSESNVSVPNMSNMSMFDSIKHLLFRSTNAFGNKEKLPTSESRNAFNKVDTTGTNPSSNSKDVSSNSQPHHSVENLTKGINTYELKSLDLQTDLACKYESEPRRQGEELDKSKKETPRSEIVNACAVTRSALYSNVPGVRCKRKASSSRHNEARSSSKAQESCNPVEQGHTTHHLSADSDAHKPVRDPRTRRHIKPVVETDMVSKDSFPNVALKNRNSSESVLQSESFITNGQPAFSCLTPKTGNKSVSNIEPVLSKIVAATSDHSKIAKPAKGEQVHKSDLNRKRKESSAVICEHKNEMKSPAPNEVGNKLSPPSKKIKSNTAPYDGVLNNQRYQSTRLEPSSKISVSTTKNSLGSSDLVLSDLERVRRFKEVNDRRELESRKSFADMEALHRKILATRPSVPVISKDKVHELIKSSDTVTGAPVSSDNSSDESKRKNRVIFGMPSTASIFTIRSKQKLEELKQRTTVEQNTVVEKKHSSASDDSLFETAIVASVSIDDSVKDSASCTHSSALVVAAIDVSSEGSSVSIKVTSNPELKPSEGEAEESDDLLDFAIAGTPVDCNNYCVESAVVDANMSIHDAENDIDLLEDSCIEMSAFEDIAKSITDSGKSVDEEFINDVEPTDSSPGSSNGIRTPSFSDDSNPAENETVRLDSKPVRDERTDTEQRDLLASTGRQQVELCVDQVRPNFDPVDELNSHNKLSIRVSSANQLQSDGDLPHGNVQREAHCEAVVAVMSDKGNVVINPPGTVDKGNVVINPPGTADKDNVVINPPGTADKVNVVINPPGTADKGNVVIHPPGTAIPLNTDIDISAKLDEDLQLEHHLEPELLLSGADDVMHQLFGDISDSDNEDFEEASKQKVIAKRTPLQRLKSDFEDGEIVESDCDRSRVLDQLRTDDHAGKTVKLHSSRSRSRSPEASKYHNSRSKTTEFSSVRLNNSKSKSPESSKYDKSRSKKADQDQSSSHSKKHSTRDVQKERHSRSNKDHNGTRDHIVSRHSDGRNDSRKERHKRRPQASPEKSHRGSHSSGKSPGDHSCRHRSPLRARVDENGRHVSSGDRKSAKSRLAKK